jgi:hypothetical protein
MLYVVDSYPFDTALEARARLNAVIRLLPSDSGLKVVPPSRPPAGKSGRRQAKP